MAFVGDAVRYVTSTVDARLVTPVANRLANSVANPYVLSYFLWDRIKKLTPQRARDLTRLLSSVLANGVGVLSADEAKRLAGTTRRLQDEVIAAAVTPQGKSVVLNSVATAAKVAQALNTPETKIATQQLFETLQSFVDFFASTPGRKIIATAGDCVSGVCEVLASPESAVLLAEVATNLCHALEVESLRRDAETALAQAQAAAAELTLKLQREQEAKERQERAHAEATRSNVFMAEEDKPLYMRSRLSSAEDTSFETESEFSMLSRANTPATGLYYHADHDHHLRTYSLSPRAAHIAQHEMNRSYGDSESLSPPTVQVKERSALRSARIEKDVLLKMGVSPTMLEDVQRILDQLREEQVREEAAATTPIIAEGEDEDQEEENAGTDNDDDAFFSSAFGTRTSSLPMDAEPVMDDQQEAKTEEEEDGVVLPEWHPEPLRAALRRRHVAAEQHASARTTFDDQSREMTQLLAKRQFDNGDLPPADALAVRVISFLLVATVAMLLLFSVVSMGRYAFA